MALKGSDSISIRAWLADLTYDEVHAFTVGFVPWALYAVVESDALLGAGIAVIMMALGHKAIETKTLRYLVREPHYALGGAVIGLALGLAVGAVA